ncbi:hypothetical protein Cni_G19345 [Canna indica]|uniref:Uncharacterized protein n=1 Tax=Canna indica TaxID=4628 RepID=A0AAQ3KR97_9LILI|nr:hypothetical protein Cni_G19345 [Canna indica]
MRAELMWRKMSGLLIQICMSRPLIQVLLITHTPHSPMITSFSSRGPSHITLGILKPDIIGPGVNVLTAWNTQKFNIISGTSMSCPHLSGIAALIKRAHPDWSPAVIKSAIMTTAYTKDNTKHPIINETSRPADYFAMSAGHVNPRKAINLGLVYDLSPEDYCPYLCGLGLSNSKVRAIVHNPVNCSLVKAITEEELNYPSITVQVPANKKRSVGLTRTVTNVGEPTSAYYAVVNTPKGVSVKVQPRVPSFMSGKEKKSFTICFRRTRGRSGVVEGQLHWVSTKRSVRSPLSITPE